MKDAKYLEYIRSLPCAICVLLAGLIEANHGVSRLNQLSKTEAAHVGERGLSQKCSDRETIPLCGIEHHREGKYSNHKLGKKFWEYWKLDRDELVTELQQAYDSARAPGS